MIFKDHPRKDWIITTTVLGIGVIIVLSGMLPFLKVNDFTKGLILGLALVGGGYPLMKYIYKGQKATFEKRNGKKLN